MIIGGDVIIDEYEMRVVNLHPKLAILPKLTIEDFWTELELGFAKIRYDFVYPSIFNLILVRTYNNITIYTPEYRRASMGTVVRNKPSLQSARES